LGDAFGAGIVHKLSKRDLELLDSQAVDNEAGPDMSEEDIAMEINGVKRARDSEGEFNAMFDYSDKM